MVWSLIKTIWYMLMQLGAILFQALVRIPYLLARKAWLERKDRVLEARLEKHIEEERAAKARKVVTVWQV